MILAGDIGGTKTILALYELKDNDWLCVNKQRFLSADFVEFSDLLAKFLADNQLPAVESICMGVAGPIVNGDCHATNLPWYIKRQAIIDQTGVSRVALLNDLEATGWGVLTLPASDFEILHLGAEVEQGHQAILAAGTGLGEALLIADGQDYHIVATEGGHTDFAPRNDLEIDLLRFLLKQYPEHVSYERIVSGQGLINIYNFFKSVQPECVSKEIEKQMNEGDPAQVIGINGTEDNNPLCSQAVSLFCQLYGAEAGNLALKCLPKKGIILAGGIAAKILPALQTGSFLQSYWAKGRYQALLKNFSIKVCLNPDVALLGAASFAQGKIR